VSVVVVAYTPSPEGEAALEHAVDEAQLRAARLVVVSRGPRLHEHHQPDVDVAALERRLQDAGIEYAVHHPTGDYDYAEEVLEATRDHAAVLVVIGIRHRTPVGKLLMASAAQRVLLDAPCPVTAVKAASAVG
jgi:nucleotide-binding universal stress UspA family protein